ncbi:MAG: hypothetical protein GY810_31710, partial [Aureispira sp.]|nr:hypothetical protein [Aureispira sp.]
EECNLFDASKSLLAQSNKGRYTFTATNPTTKDGFDENEQPVQIPTKEEEFYAAVSYDQVAGMFGHPLGNKSIDGEDLTFEGYPANLQNWVESTKHRRFLVKEMHISSNKQETIDKGELEITQNISLLNPKGQSHYISLSGYVQSDSFNKKAIEVKDRPFYLDPTTRIKANVQSGSYMKIIFVLEAVC